MILFTPLDLVDSSAKRLGKIEHIVYKYSHVRGHSTTTWTRRGGGGVSKKSTLVHPGGGGGYQDVHVDKGKEES